MGKRSFCGAQNFWEIRGGAGYEYGNGPGQVSLELCQDSVASSYFGGRSTSKDHKINDGIFHHLAFVRVGTQALFYVDGNLDQTFTNIGQYSFQSTSAFRMGLGACAFIDGERYFTGSLDEIELYSRALSPEEVTSTYEYGLSGPPTIVTQPQNWNAIAGEYAEFDVTVLGMSLAYQWYFNNNPIDGATAKTFAIPAVAMENAGSYKVVISNSFGTVTSSNASLVVYSPAEFPRGLIGYWKGDGDANDSFGNNHGTLYNGTSFAPGKFGQAFEFDGVNDYVNLGNVGNFGTNNFTIAFWIKTSSDRAEAVMGKRAVCNAANFWDIRVAPMTEYGMQSGHISLELCQDSSGAYYFGRNVTSMMINDSTFHHIAFVRELNTVKYFVDGVQDRTFPAGPINFQSFADFTLGRSACTDWDGEQHFTGLLDEIMLFNRALPGSDIQGLMNGSFSAPQSPEIIVQPTNQRRIGTNAAVFSVVAIGAEPLSYQWLRGSQPITDATNSTLEVLDTWTTNGFRAIVSNPFGSATSHVAYIIKEYPAGMYHGLFYESDEVRHQSSGLLNLRLRTSGSFSGNLICEGKKYSFTGLFSGDSVGFSVVRSNRTLTVNLHLESGVNEGMLTGTISDGTWTANLNARRTPFDRKNPCPYIGKYTLTVTPTTDEGPDGTSFGTVIVPANGAARFSGSLADDTRVSQSIGLSADGTWPLYAMVYKGTGSVLGWLSFTNTTDSSLQGEVSWIKSGKFGKYFNNGFTNRGELLGSTYAPPTNRAPINVTNAVLTLNGDDISITNGVTLRSTNAVAGLTQILTIDPKSGLFKGTVTDPAKKTKIPVKGALLQQQTNGSGFFLQTNFNGQVNLKGQ